MRHSWPCHWLRQQFAAIPGDLGNFGVLGSSNDHKPRLTVR
ncbi:hypothetical protein I553_3857 [Mycobacterium xenopi 4042]|uniref:Uncharacterized protein n=1 Tax=Mycobacterium xenopi 4042 TaxID=1299334 RepID=X8APK1_MYCXE|nr:hypothetical protein I553_3857 [Mycobacterium xenopi 4042]